jgi:hypothetical protein
MYFALDLFIMYHGSSQPSITTAKHQEPYCVNFRDIVLTHHPQRFGNIQKLAGLEGLELT